MAMRRSRSLWQRLERLETVQRMSTATAGREAFIEMWPHDGERHLVMTSAPDAGRCWFPRANSGPGPQLADFGEFSLVLHVTEAEMNS